MKTVEMLKWGNGYYVTKREGCNVTREFVKARGKVSAEERARKLKEKWEKA